MKMLMLAGALFAVSAATPAHADELFGGLLVHDVKTPFTLSGVERGVDLQAGWRGGRLGATPLQPYLFGSIHSEGQTHFAAIGLSARFGDKVYFRPGLGLAIHSGSDEDFFIGEEQIAFGNRVLFAPEMSVGIAVNERLSLEASIVHLSHGQVFGGQNPGMDSIGMRLNVKL